MAVGVGVGVEQTTVSEAESSPEPSLSVVKLAVLLYVPQLLVVVLLTTCAVVLVLPANVVRVYWRLWFGGTSRTTQPGSVLPASIVQKTPVPAGKLSVTERPVVVVGLLLVRVTVKPICEPALTLEASTVLVMMTPGVGVGVGVDIGVGVGVAVAVAVAVAVGVGV